MKDYIFGSIFGKSQEPVEEGEYERFRAEVMNVGGMLHFAVTREDTGWSAICEEIDAIVTGGDEINPDNELIESRIREAIQTAFHLPMKVQLGAVMQNIANPVFQLQGAF